MASDLEVWKHGNEHLPCTKGTPLLTVKIARNPLMSVKIARNKTVQWQCRRSLIFKMNAVALISNMQFLEEFANLL